MVTKQAKGKDDNLEIDEKKVERWRAVPNY